MTLRTRRISCPEVVGRIFWRAFSPLCSYGSPVWTCAVSRQVWGSTDLQGPPSDVIIHFLFDVRFLLRVLNTLNTSMHLAAFLLVCAHKTYCLKQNATPVLFGLLAISFSTGNSVQDPVIITQKIVHTLWQVLALFTKHMWETTADGSENCICQGLEPPSFLPVVNMSCFLLGNHSKGRLLKWIARAVVWHTTCALLLAGQALFSPQPTAPISWKNHGKNRRKMHDESERIRSCSKVRQRYNGGEGAGDIGVPGKNNT